MKTGEKGGLVQRGAVLDQRGGSEAFEFIDVCSQGQIGMFFKDAAEVGHRKSELSAERRQGNLFRFGTVNR